MNNSYLKSINELLTFNFIVPSYQRGYRWKKRQIIDLLDDIYDFIQKRENKDYDIGDFYCLQPVIINQIQEKTYRLIDGQQRLTTIYIILYFLDKRKFSIEFETRERSKEFLQEKLSNGVNTDNVDFYYISKAYDYISKWFNEKEKNEATIFDEFYINLGKYTKVIWYQISSNENEIDVFTRTNSGKIHLTNAELIKALFLNKNNFNENEKDLRQVEIAKEWDEIEYFLQNDEFWKFATHDIDFPTRIELLFEIFSNKEIKDEFTTYRYFSKKENILNLWANNDESIKKVYASIKYWFEDRKLYHILGFLIATGYDIKEIYQEFKVRTKSDFQTYILKKIKNEIDITNIEKLEYPSDNDKINKTLLLFNIATILNNNDSYIRFAFDKFNKEKWSLEHIHAQQDKGFKSTEIIKKWLNEVKIELKKINSEKAKEIIVEIDSVLNIEKLDKDNETFLNLKNSIFDFFGEPDIHTIDNLALLSTNVNSALSNNIFPIKRKILIDKDKGGAFIPLCTKNVFLKYYSNQIQNINFWNSTDRKNYLEEIKKVLNEF